MKRHLLLIVVAAVLVFGTLALPVTIDQATDLQRVRHGAPLPFVWQNLADLVPMGHTTFPFRTAVVSPWEYPTEWSLPALLLNLALVWGGLGLIVAALGRTRHRRASVADALAAEKPPQASDGVRATNPSVWLTCRSASPRTHRSPPRRPSRRLPAAPMASSA